MADYTSGQVNFAGLGNGTDFNALIEGLVDVEMARVRRLETWKSSWETKNEEFKTLNTKMLSMKTTLESMDTMNEFLAKSVSTTDSKLLTATANSDIQEAAYNIEIGSLATNDILATASGTSALTDSITSSTTNFTFSYAGESYTLSNISAGTTLEGLVSYINHHAESKDKVRASTIFDGNTYHLQIAGRDLGADNQVIISDTGSMIFKPSDFNESQNAGNAKIKVNGFPPGADEWLERDSNQIKDAVDGLTLNLKNAEPGTQVTLTVSTDTNKIKENVHKFVEAVNIVRTQLQKITKIDTSTKEVQGSILSGNYGVDIIGQNLKNIVADVGKGFEFYNDKTKSGDLYSALSQIGIHTDPQEGSETYGLLKIDDEELDKALKENPTEVAKLFAASDLGESHSPDMTFMGSIKGTTKPGVYDVQIQTSGAGISTATINGHPAKVSGWYITGIPGTDAAGISIRLDNRTANASYSGKVTLKQGKTGELIDELKELTKPFNKHTHQGGPLAVLQENYGDIMDGIDDKIDYENTRIDRMERNLRLKFARLDALLGQYDQKMASLNAQMAQLMKS
ncbi:flagellar filament capping protein FliD [Pseudodesulfovibrio tunisiensis]|uniref:flagellar filament capping protein FliD n=1 Tax=Pseudodesulfovibrio tunisiensis TaxID=463192 RepID=UPI001FB442E8|nr:flagellar filament capping protein FliD [Pseudodesulfovibrio tunisiensis]